MKLFVTSAVMASVLSLAGCAGMQDESGNYNKTGKGAGIGAASGAVLGALVDHRHRGQGALIGAALGAAAGGAYGHHLDKQEAELRQQMQGSGVGIERQGDNLNIILPGNITFASNKAEIQPSFRGTLDQLAQSLTQYPDSTVQIVGHTDNTGSLQLNNELSTQRAQAVGLYLTSHGVASPRIQTYGAGPNQPIADNSTPDGRAQNRRVEIKVIPAQQPQGQAMPQQGYQGGY